MSLLCLVIVGKDNEPLYQRDFGSFEEGDEAAAGVSDDCFGFASAMQSTKDTISLRHEVRIRMKMNTVLYTFTISANIIIVTVVHDARRARLFGRSHVVRKSRARSICQHEMDRKAVSHGRDPYLWYVYRLCVVSLTCS